VWLTYNNYHILSQYVIVITIMYNIILNSNPKSQLKINKIKIKIEDKIK